MKNSEEQNEKSIQALFIDINRHYAGRCLQQVEEMGIHPRQIPIMMILHNFDGCTQKEMADLLEIKPPTVNVSIQRLEKAGLVCRKKDVHDQRIMRVYLTEKGKQADAGIIKRMGEMEQMVFGNFSETELCLLRRFLGQMLENMDKIPGPSVDRCKFMKKEGQDE